MKQLTHTISPDMWQAYKEAVSIRQGLEVDEEQAEEIAKMDMWKGMQNTINTTKHPETGLSKQQMTHHRRGVLAAKQWLFSEKGAERAEFEEAGRTWSSRASKFAYIQELILQGWLATWKE